MPSKFIVIDRDQFTKALESKGFVLDTGCRGELVYVRQHHIDPTMFIKIYTSLPQKGGDTRGLGQDAIRVVLIFENKQTNKSGCLYKAARVHRTGTSDGVIERTLERARDAYRIANERLKKA